MTYKPGGGGENRRTISSVEKDITCDVLQKLYDRIDVMPLEKWAESERGNIQALIEKMIDEVDDD
jgi:hypothetical protein